jgi:hypothetical protein
MNRTRRTIGITAFIMLAALGTGWALEKALSHSHPGGRPALVEPAKTSDILTAPVMGGPADTGDVGQPATTDSSPEYDRSDLILSQG